MARDGFRTSEADTHVGPTRDALEGYLSASERAPLEPLSDKRVTGRNGQVSYHVGERKYARRLGETSPRAADPGAYMGAFAGSHKGRDPDPRVDHNPAARIADVGLEGDEANLLLPSVCFGACASADTATDI